MELFWMTSILAPGRSNTVHSSHVGGRQVGSILCSTVAALCKDSHGRAGSYWSLNGAKCTQVTAHRSSETSSIGTEVTHKIV